MSTTAERAKTDLATLPAGKLIARMADRFGVDQGKLLTTLKATAFKVKDGEATNEQMMALMVVADQFNLNPFTREIFAFPDKQNGIVPVVSVDGWSRIINDHEMLDGIEFRYSETTTTPPGGKPCPEWCEIVIKRKDRANPIVVREYLDEVYREAFKGQYGPINGPWQSHTKRMLRHKTLIQGSRLAFGFGGIYDEDEAGRIIEGQVINQEAGPRVVTEAHAAIAANNEGVDPNKRAHVIADLAARADEGVEALEQTWAAMDEDTRLMVGMDEFERLKKLAVTKASNGGGTAS